ncbi:hypothetical protein HY768_10160 [candidate division TA06 bacterium]|uniref:Uncharacterized protein n=1 Tax=candidate division TA06 bacterium TaxID=2250710 RepID=A0A933IC39_UNCT6|nr:hypothetical protein [candidate division TA06 bacterium]
MSPEQISPPEILEWSVHPFAESPKRAVVAVLAPVITCLLVYLWMQSWFWVGLAFLLIISSELPFFLKTSYRFDEKGIAQKRGGVVQSRTWEQIKSYYPDRTGVLVSPFLQKTWLENFRGLYLQFGKHREEVLSYLGKKIPQDKPPS